MNLSVKCHLLLSDLNDTWIFSTDSPPPKKTKYQIPWKSIQWELICSMRMDRQWDMTKLKVTFCNFVYTSENTYYQRHDQKMYLQKLTELFRFSPDLPEHKYTEDELPRPVAVMYCTIWSHKLQHLTVNGTSLVVTYANTRGCTSLSECMCPWNTAPATEHTINIQWWVLQLRHSEMQNSVTL